MKNEPGYPLPAGELGDDEIVCQLVFLPNRPEYWQALVGALGYMATWRAWERDADKRGKDAASNWREAFELTMECWRMACLESLQDDVAEILAIMQLGNQCCDNQDITDGDRYTDRVEDGEGDVPQPVIDAGYAEDAADWDGFDDYKCMIAHVTINQMEARLREIAEVVDSAGPYLAVAAALSAIMGVIVATGGLAIVFGILAGIGTVSALYYALIEFGPVSDLADEVNENHDELTCAIYNSDGDVGALVALNDKIDALFSVPEALILKNLNNGPTLKMLYAGRYDQQDIAEILFEAGYELPDFQCDCEGIGEYQTFTEIDAAGWDNWQNWLGWLEHNGMDGGYCWVADVNEAATNLFKSMQRVCEGESINPGVGDKILIHRVTFWYKFTQYYDTHRLELTVNHDGGEDIYFYPHQLDFTYVTRTFSPPLECTYNLQGVVMIKSDGAGYQMYVDRVLVDWTYIPAP